MLIMVSAELDFGEYIIFEKKKRFGIITLNRVHRANSFSIEQLEYLKKAVEYCQENQGIRIIILTHNGDSFSTGMDLGAIDGGDHDAVKYLEKTAADICKLLYNGKPAICAVDGRCWGEGAVYMICCDYRIATRESSFWFPEINSGIFPGTGCIILYSKIIGIPWTKKMLMFAEKVTPETAKNINLLDDIVNSKEELMKLAMKKAQFISTKNQTVINTIKLCSNHLMDLQYDEAYEIEKQGSAWWEHRDKNQFIEDFRNLFDKSGR